jgi:hypothetical protein
VKANRFKVMRSIITLVGHMICEFGSGNRQDPGRLPEQTSSLSIWNTPDIIGRHRRFDCLVQSHLIAFCPHLLKF